MAKQEKPEQLDFVEAEAEAPTPEVEQLDFVEAETFAPDPETPLGVAVTLEDLRSDRVFVYADVGVFQLINLGRDEYMLQLYKRG